MIRPAFLVALLVLAFAAPVHAQSFGKTTAGAVPSDGLRADYKRGSRFALTEQATVTQLCAYLDGLGGVSATQSVRLALYRDAGGVPGIKVGEIRDAYGVGWRSGFMGVSRHTVSRGRSR